MSAKPKRVKLTDAERGQLFAAGDHHPDMCDCTDRAAEVGYAPDSEEVCEALVNTFVVVERIKAAARREALQEAREDIRERRRRFVGLGCHEQYLLAMDDCFGLVNNLLTMDDYLGLVNNRLSAALAEPEHDEEATE